MSWKILLQQNVCLDNVFSSLLRKSFSSLSVIDLNTLIYVFPAGRVISIWLNYELFLRHLGTFRTTSSQPYQMACLDLFQNLKYCKYMYTNLYKTARRSLNNFWGRIFPIIVCHRILSLFVFTLCQEFKQQWFENSYKRDFSRIEINRIHVSSKVHYSLVPNVAVLL